MKPIVLGVNTVLKSMKLKPEDIILYNDNTYRAVINTCEATAQFSCIAGKIECIY